MLQPTDTACYKQPKAKIGRSRVRPWVWMAFSNSARSDGLKLCHWRRKADEGKEYPFAQFGKSRHDVVYSEEEFNVWFYLFCTPRVFSFNPIKSKVKVVLKVKKRTQGRILLIRKFRPPQTSYISLCIYN